MGIFEQVKEIVANEADGLMKALHHVAQELDAVKQRVPTADIAKLEGTIALSINGKVDAFLNKLREDLGARVDAIEQRLAALTAPEAERVVPLAQPAPAAPPQAPAPGPVAPETPAA